MNRCGVRFHARQRFAWLALVLLAGGIAPRVPAAISQGPVSTNLTETERFQSAKLQAYVSLQHKTEVARERYAAKQAYRNSVVAGMASELDARRQVVLAGNEDTGGAADSGALHWLMWGLPALLMALVGYHFCKHRNDFAATRELR